MSQTIHWSVTFFSIKRKTNPPRKKPPTMKKKLALLLLLNYTFLTARSNKYQYKEIGTGANKETLVDSLGKDPSDTTTDTEKELHLCSRNTNNNSIDLLSHGSFPCIIRVRNEKTIEVITV